MVGFSEFLRRFEVNLITGRLDMFSRKPQDFGIIKFPARRVLSFAINSPKGTAS